MDVGAALTWLNGLGLTASESLLAGAVVALAGALVAYARHVEQRDRAERQYQRDEHLAGRTYMQAMIDHLMDELGKHGAAAPTTARTLETFDERLERIERALMERRL